MMMLNYMSMTVADALALVLFVAAWLGIGWVTEHPPAGKPSVSVLMVRYRRAWMDHFVTREPRIFDGNILASLREGTAFFASACMIAIGGGLAVLGNAERLRGLADDLEMADRSALVWQAKLVLVLALVGNAFLKFVWAHRLFGYCAIMMGAVPNSPADPEARPRAMQAADLNITAARSFNAGLRSVYFAMAALGWLAGPWGLMAATAAVLFVTWRREFASESRRVMLRALPAPEWPDHVPAPPPAPAPPPP